MVEDFSVIGVVVLGGDVDVLVVVSRTVEGLEVLGARAAGNCGTHQGQLAVGGAACMLNNEIGGKKG